MKDLSKKRSKAMFIDFIAATAALAVLETAVPKKVKANPVYTLVVPTLVVWGLEYVQLAKSGQTLGYKAQGLILESEDGLQLSGEQIAKRFLYRDLKSPIDLFKNREGFERLEGAKLPHDVYAQTIVREQRSI
ncbi:RDD family protein [Planococcus shenhongbingii]|uniref:RDD family protein n=1 Tax=Planococcus shenhongbingii TaxID=3058398 RepID=A0ABT8NFJ0_9BACL|nr:MULTISPECIES: RDD family protein [unclassified Planococcus (in: firmicutes)]MDN7246442.1 RDD family protein [Planococcus sp. N017]WKA59434.1 RDD family protein [Planococcus sp. N016]